jgi:putative ABC transport system substrate-binding protein
MRRRDFIKTIGGAAAWPLAARAQQAERMRRIGVLMGYAESDREGQANVAAFQGGLQKLGWTEGRNIRIDARWAAADADLMQRFAKELVALQPDLIVTQNTPTTALMLQQTRTIPIIFANVSDPVGSGFVAGLPRPGGNVTGFIDMEGSMAGKWLELLKEVAPRVTRVAFLFNPATAPFAEYYLNHFKAAAASFAVEAIAAPVRDTSELESVVAAQAREPNSFRPPWPSVQPPRPRSRGSAWLGPAPPHPRPSVALGLAEEPGRLQNVYWLGSELFSGGAAR